ncbi:MAG: M1 family metallopeptidase [Chloroflexota bacterium]|nr:M1 family metallopeptidase [Chloroflexota bacterium]
MRGRSSRFLVVPLLVALGFARSIAGLAWDATPDGIATPDAGLYTAVLADQRESIATETVGTLSRYTIAATLNPATGADLPATISGSQTLRFVNQTSETLAELPFRLYANTSEYGEGGIDVEEVRVGGAVAATVLDVGETVLAVTFPAPLAPAETVELIMAFTTTVPVAPAESYGMFAISPELGTWALAHWYPVLAGYDPRDGWSLLPPTLYGDPIFTATSLYDVTLTAPAAWTVVASGVRRETPLPTISDERVHHYVTGPARDFTIVADDDFESVSQVVDGTTVVSHFNPNHPETGAAIATYGARALRLFNELFGPYPYAELDLVEVPLRNALGVEFSQLIYMDSDLYGSDVPEVLTDSTVAHEVAHQWFYGLVGNNQHESAFIDEGLSNYLAFQVYYERVYDAERAMANVNRFLLLPYLRSLFEEGGDVVVDQPSDDFSSARTYTIAVYFKAALGFAALRGEIGEEAFFAGLRDYAAAERFAIAEPADLRLAFEAAAGRDLGAFWTHWFEAAEGNQDFTPADLERLRSQLG